MFTSNFYKSLLFTPHNDKQNLQCTVCFGSGLEYRKIQICPTCNGKGMCIKCVNKGGLLISPCETCRKCNGSGYKKLKII
jgi:DnaJ-class molecular chaperone